jgi:hypothetical protein
VRVSWRAQAQDEPIKQVQFSSSGQKVMSCDVTGRVYVWSMHAEFLTNLMRVMADKLSAAAMSNDFKLCLVGLSNGCGGGSNLRGRAGGPKCQGLRHAGERPGVRVPAQLFSGRAGPRGVR